jgi:hypothetical protein
MKGATYAKMMEVIGNRRLDIRFILDSLDQIEGMAPDLKGKLDTSRLIAAGHSMGSATAMAMVGVVMIDPRDGSRLGIEEDRFDVAIIISEPGNMRLMPTTPWTMSTVPTFVATGSNDFSSMGKTRGQKAKTTYQLPPDAKRNTNPTYYLYMEGSDHYLGGAICRDDVPGPKDYEAVSIVNATTTAFLNAYIKDDSKAMAFIRSETLGEKTDGRAALTIR